MTHSQLIDLSRLPDKDREAILHIAERSNALGYDLNQLRGTVHAALGATEEEQDASNKILELFRMAWAWIAGHRFNVLGGTFVAFLILQILKAVGVDTTAIAPIIEKVLTHLSGVL